LTIKCGKGSEGAEGGQARQGSIYDTTVALYGIGCDLGQTSEGCSVVEKSRVENSIVSGMEIRKCRSQTFDVLEAYFVNGASGYLGGKGFVEEREQCFIDGRA
jgi:hypothetical protein